MFTFCFEGSVLEKLMDDLRQEMESNPPLPGAFTARKGETCAARFSQDNQWYRAKVEKVEGNTATVLFLDYGNVSFSHLFYCGIVSVHMVV